MPPKKKAAEQADTAALIEQAVNSAGSEASLDELLSTAKDILSGKSTAEPEIPPDAPPPVAYGESGPSWRSGMLPPPPPAVGPVMPPMDMRPPVSIDCMPPPPPTAPKTPTVRPRSASNAKPMPIVADDAELDRIALYSAKLTAYRALMTPEQAQSMFFPHRTAPSADWELALRQARQRLMSGNEEQWLRTGLTTGAGLLEAVVPMLARVAPAHLQPYMDVSGLRSDMAAVLGETKFDDPAMTVLQDQMRRNVAICAVDLYGMLAVNPWAMLGLSTMQMIQYRAQSNYTRKVEYARAAAMSTGVPMPSDGFD